MNDIINIGGVDCYEKDGTAYLKLETVARGLGFTQQKNGTEYVKFPTSGERRLHPRKPLLPSRYEGQERSRGKVPSQDCR